MRFRLDRVHVWAGEVEDKAGGVAAKLLPLAQAGANLGFVFTQRRPDKPGAGILYVAPLSGPEQLKAAKVNGLHEVNDPVIMRFEGDNEQGLAHRLTQAWALAGISFQGLTMAVMNGKFVGYAAFDTIGDSNKAATILADLGTH
ncbi:MAG TPA: amino acid-binding ACT [Gemmataceae bacterium]|nr:amino acid-binding ACT [Gemmataceae bacterium]